MSETIFCVGSYFKQNEIVGFNEIFVLCKVKEEIDLLVKYRIVHPYSSVDDQYIKLEEIKRILIDEQILLILGFNQDEEDKKFWYCTLSKRKIKITFINNMIQLIEGGDLLSFLQQLQCYFKKVFHEEIIVNEEKEEALIEYLNKFSK